MGARTQSHFEGDGDKFRKCFRITSIDSNSKNMFVHARTSEPQFCSDFSFFFFILKRTAITLYKFLSSILFELYPFQFERGCQIPQNLLKKRALYSYLKYFLIFFSLVSRKIKRSPC